MVKQMLEFLEYLVRLDLIASIDPFKLNGLYLSLLSLL